MALTKSNEAVNSALVFQANFIIKLTLALDNSYPQASGGYDLAGLLDGLPNDYGILHVEVAETATHYFTFEGGKLRVWVKGAPDAEAGDGVDLSTITGLLVTVWAE